MPLDRERLLQLGETGVRAYDARDSILYALGVGYGRDPLDARELAYVYEGAGLRAVPTLATTLVGGEQLLADAGVTLSGALHLRQRLQAARPLAAEGEVGFEMRILDCRDRGPGRGALLTLQAELRAARGGELLCVMESVILARADGGFGGPPPAPAAPRHGPERPPDERIAFEIRPEQAALYRLCGDRNPLHIDPACARRAGFERPILHGLCSYGFAARLLAGALCGGDADRIETLEVRFARPAYPGDALVLELWREGGEILFRAHAPAFGHGVLEDGRCRLRA